MKIPFIAFVDSQFPHVLNKNFTFFMKNFMGIA